MIGSASTAIFQIAGVLSSLLGIQIQKERNTSQAGVQSGLAGEGFFPRHHHYKSQ
jgi:hypothetical protein